MAWFALHGALAWADPPAVEGAAKGQVSDAQKRQQAVAAIQRLIREANQLRAAGKLEDAVGVGGKAVGLARDLDGDVSETVASLEDWLAPFHESREDWSAARAARETSLAVRKSLYGENDWRVTDARLALADVDLHMRLDTKGRRELAESDQLRAQIRALRQMGEPAKGIPLANRALEIRRRLLGPEHAQVSVSLTDLSVLYETLKQHAQAESFGRQALEIRRKVAGDIHPETATCVHNLAFIEEVRGDFAKAEGYYVESLEIRRKALGERDALTAQSFDALVALRGKLVAQKLVQADYASARRIQGDVTQMLSGRYGERNWRVTDARLGQADIDLRERLSPEGRAQLKVADEQERERVRLAEQRRFREALAPAERVLAIQRKFEGDEHRDTARSLNDLGMLYINLKEFAKVEPLIRESLAIRLKLLGEEHPDTALALFNMGKLFEYEGEFAKAEPCYERSLAIRGKVLAPRHAATVEAYDCLTQTEMKLVGQSLAKGDYAVAKSTQDRLTRFLALRYGDRDWRVTNARWRRRDIDLVEGLSPEARAELKEADRHNVQREQLDVRGHYVEALAEAERALAIRKKIQGELHPATATCLNYAAVLNDRLDEHAKAESLYKQAVEIDRKVVGELHPDTALCLRTLGQSYASRGEFEKAEPLCRRDLEIRLRIQGDKDAETVVSWDRLLGLRSTMLSRLLERSDYAGAVRIQSETLPLVARRYGDSDWHVIDARLQLQDLKFREKLSPEERAQLKHAQELEEVGHHLYEQGRFRESTVPEEQALEIRKKLLGEAHPSTAQGVNNVAASYERLHADGKVEPLYKQALQIRRKVLGDSHPATAVSLANLADLYAGQGKLDQAEALYRDALGIQQRVLGEKDNLTVATFMSLMAIYRKKAIGQAEAADYTAARQVQIESIRLLAQRYGERNWRVSDARWALRDLERRQRLTPEARAQLKKAEELDAVRLRFFEQERFRESLVAAREELEIRKRVMGEEHPDTAACLDRVGVLYYRLVDYAKAEPFSRQALELRRKILGDAHPATASSTNNFAVLCRAKGDDSQAEPLYMRALDIDIRLLGKSHNQTMITFNELLSLQPKMVARYRAAGDYAAARKIQEDMVQVLAANYGPQDARVAEARRGLGDLESRARLSAESREELKKAELRDAEARRLFEKRQYREALAPVQEILAIRAKALGPEHPDTVGTFKNLDFIYVQLIGESLARDDYAAAGRLEGELSRLFANRFGEKDWRANDARLRQRDYEGRAQLSPEGRANLKLAAELDKENARLDTRHAYREALHAAEEVLALNRKVFGEEHLETVKSLNRVAVAHDRLNEHDIAESYLRQVLEITRKIVGEEHPQTALVLHNLARICEAKGEVEKALPLFQEALAIRKLVLGETAVATRTAYDDLALLERTIADQKLEKGDFAAARRLLDEELGLLRQRYGDKDWRVTDVRLQQAEVELRERLSPEARAELKKADKLSDKHFEIFKKRQYADAAAVAQQMLETCKKLRGDEDRETASAYYLLALDLGLLGKHAESVPHAERALAMRRRILGEEHPDTTYAYQSLSTQHENLGNYAAAAQYAERALAIRRKISGDDDPETANCCLALGNLFLTTGECTTARGYFERALAIRRKNKGEDHPDTAEVYSDLGSIFVALGDNAAARRSIERGAGHPGQGPR